MSFDYLNWSNLNYGDGAGYACFRYGTADTIADTFQPGYFDPAFWGDKTILMIEASDGKAIVRVSVVGGTKVVTPWTLPSVQCGRNVTSSVSGTVISYTSSFLAEPALSISPRDMVSGDYYQITASSASGFSLTFYDSTDTPVARHFDWMASNNGWAR